MTRQEMTLDLLAQMHLLLREHGWEPDSDHFRWTLAGFSAKMCAFWLPNKEGVHCLEFIGSQVRHVHTSIAALRRRLKELAR
jgi:hypothetical protein